MPALPEWHCHQLVDRPARTTGPQPVHGGRLDPHAARLLGLQRAAGNRATAGLLAGPAVQRCGPTPCDCPAEERRQQDEPTAPPEHTAVQRVRAEFQVTGKYAGTAGRPHELFFDRQQVTLDEDERAKLGPVATSVSNDLSRLVLRGYASEDEARPAKAARLRLDAVVQALKEQPGATNEPTIGMNPDSWWGNMDYRDLRRVEIVTPTTPPPLDCSNGGRVDCAAAGYAVSAAIDLGQALITATSAAVDKAPLLPKLFGKPPPTDLVRTNLGHIRNQLDRYRPAAPADDLGAGGHECFNECVPTLLAKNDRLGTTARLALGILYRDSTNKSRAYNLVHEASHGTPELAAADHAYLWQRRFDFLSQAEALSNADSYAYLVAQLNGLTQAPLGASEAESARYDLPPRHASTSTVNMPPEVSRKVMEVRAWLEHYVIQAMLEVRDLYGLVATAIRTGTWPAEHAFYRDNTYHCAAARFGLTRLSASRPVPTRDDLAELGGVLDRLRDLEIRLTGEQVLVSGDEHAPIPAGLTGIMFPPDQLSLSPPGLAYHMLADLVGATDTVPQQHKVGYGHFLIDICRRHGGPLAKL